jgi:hypothetical protein
MSKRMDKVLAADQKREERVIKLLLLGAARPRVSVGTGGAS